MDDLWTEEAEKRLQAYREGRLKGIPMQDVFRDEAGGAPPAGGRPGAMPARLAKSVSAVLLGALAGLCMAWLVWMRIYAVGARLITDQEHNDYAAGVSAAGAMAGVLIGFCAAFLCRRPISAVLAAHLCAGVAFLVLQTHSWQHGLTVYAVALAVCATGWVLLLRQTNGSSSPGAPRG